MAKKGAVEKNKRRERMVKAYASKRKELKAQLMDKELPPEDRFVAAMKLSELPRNASKVRIRNRCEVSGRPRAYYRRFKMSRIAMRDLGNTGKIPGLVKSSW